MLYQSKKHIKTAAISMFINKLSIKWPKYLDTYKIAKLIPLVRKGLKMHPKNHWSISRLPLLSKLIEKAIHTQTQENLAFFTLQVSFKF